MNMNIQYRKEGDYNIPDWTIPKDQQKPLGLYGRMRKAYLEEHRSGLYTRMLLAGTLYDHLYETDRAAQERMDTILPKLAASAGATEELKAKDQMKWVGIMNACKAQVEELANSTLPAQPEG